MREAKPRDRPAWTGLAAGRSQIPEAPPIVYEVLRSPGQPLDRTSRDKLESRFGHDFSRVRLHTDAKAEESARLVDALAYTVGTDIVFGARQYAPRTAEWWSLLMHEATHVVQQGGRSWTGRALEIARPTSLAEREADSSEIGISQFENPLLARRVPAPAVRPPVRPPARRPFRVIPGGKRGPGEEEKPGAETEPAPERYGRAEYPSTLEEMLERGAEERRRMEDIWEAERPRATLERGGEPPHFITVWGEQLGMWGWGTSRYQVRKLHVLDAIEYEVGRATTEADLEGTLSSYIGFFPLRRDALGLRLPPPRIVMPRDVPKLYPDFDPGALVRLEVYAKAVERRAATIPALAKSPLAAKARVPEATRRRGCTVKLASPLGEELDPLATVYCQYATGIFAPFEFRVTAPTGDWAQYDSMVGNVAYECKCGYASIFRDLSSSDPRRRYWAESSLRKRDEQMLRQRRVAAACGLSLRWYVSNKRFAEILTERWSGNPAVLWVPWTECD